MKDYFLSYVPYVCVMAFSLNCAAQQPSSTPNINVDIHAHISIKPYNMSYPNLSESTDLWQEQVVSTSKKVYKFPKFLGQYNKVPAVSCANLNKLTKGNVHVVFASICPVQQEFASVRTWAKPLLLNRQKYRNMVAYFSGCNEDKVLQLQQKKVDYFEEMQNELYFLQRDAGKILHNNIHTYKIAQNYQQLNNILQTEPNTIVIVQNIEGGHALGTGTPQSIKLAKKDPQALQNTVINNINKLKQGQYPIFSITLANHFWNQLCGQTRTNKGIMTALVNEKKGENSGITLLGHTAIEQLLSDKNGKPILIDIKHMSIQSRLDYYQLHQQMYPNVPIIYSHGGVNGIASSQTKFKEGIFIKDKSKEIRKAYLHPWSFNLYDDEIKIIYQSNGLIGIMLEDTRLGGKKATKSINKTIDGTSQRRNEYLKVFMANAFHIVKTINDPKAWDIIAVGSDFDGAINPLNQYADASRFPEFRNDLTNFLQQIKDYDIVLSNQNYPFSNQEVIALMYQYTPEQIVDKILATNTLHFLAQNFR